MNLFVLTYSNMDGSHLPNTNNHHVIIVAEFTNSTNASILCYCEIVISHKQG